MNQNETKDISKKKRKRVTKILLWLILLGMVCYAGLIGLVYYWEISVPDPENYDSIIVLGAQVLPTGEASVQLQWRLDTAFALYEQQPDVIIVTSGGQGSNEPAPEGDVMRDILISMGVPEDQVISEPDSADTTENISFSSAILDSIGCDTPVIVTSDYHLPRALANASDLGIVVQGEGSPCRSELSYWLQNHMREALAWVKYWGIKYLGLPL